MESEDWKVRYISESLEDTSIDIIELVYRIIMLSQSGLE